MRARPTNHHATGPSGRPPTWTERAAAPVSGASLVVVRVALGVVVLASAARTLTYGWADSLYSRPRHRFTYLGLDWVPQPGPLLQ